MLTNIIEVCNVYSATKSVISNFLTKRFYIRKTNNEMYIFYKFQLFLIIIISSSERSSRFLFSFKENNVPNFSRIFTKAIKK